MSDGNFSRTTDDYARALDVVAGRARVVLPWMIETWVWTRDTHSPFDGVACLRCLRVLGQNDRALDVRCLPVYRMGGESHPRVWCSACVVPDLRAAAEGRGAGMPGLAAWTTPRRSDCASCGHTMRRSVRTLEVTNPSTRWPHEVHRYCYTCGRSILSELLATLTGGSP